MVKKERLREKHRQRKFGDERFWELEKMRFTVVMVKSKGASSSVYSAVVYIS